VVKKTVKVKQVVEGVEKKSFKPAKRVSPDISKRFITSSRWR
jgi:hypothetical protein